MRKGTNRYTKLNTDRMLYDILIVKKEKPCNIVTKTNCIIRINFAFLEAF